ncbi:HAD family hydrolase [Actinosynnema mirum]|uniref:HAD-superfamily hydrolase, subfamily IA, variant 3 n=1 Tax=Actinosynnema mirum (strain ATCC 29888 / DSM 43827 / JCM 3225 / NBRC 14064 / NCIMB 13271 / NRRL B-12336 / IMRU 3971 / 101) TaxID=446462 RepID=C6WQZ7_ACTMD|nr:HAD family phosphatase [Actinosynnema mirum]ACU40690.1 HAD-superfamily hydrolase, subfamily IA, variant 3 [Actinosynnema mirum DSM 43827]
MRWIVFDYGEVISHPSEELPRLAALLGVADVGEAYWRHRDAYDRGLSDEAYWALVGAEHGLDVGPELAGRLAEVDRDGWMRPSGESVALIGELASAGVPLALLSNAASSFGRAVERQAWTRHFRHLVFSGDLGVIKPDPEVWRLLAERLGVEPGDCVFLDDRQVNVDGAVAAGMSGLLWRGVADARERLVGLGVL